jgi:hypothetical protein
VDGPEANVVEYVSRHNPFGGHMMGRLHTRDCIVVSVHCKDFPERGVWSSARERRDIVAILVVNEAEERADGMGRRWPMCWQR